MPLVLEILGVPEDHRLRRLPVAASGVSESAVDPRVHLGLCLGTGAVAYDENGVAIARLDQPLCVNNRWVIDLAGGYLSPWAGQDRR